MRAVELIKSLQAAHRRFHMAGDEQWGVIAALDLEGRLFTVVAGEVVNRVNPAAIADADRAGGYRCPGGDGLWPAPEGTLFGYQYATGAWRVPPAITNARYRVAEAHGESMDIRADADLVNAGGLGVPVLLERRVGMARSENKLTVSVTETVQYCGARTLTRGECLIAPWTLCQFDCGSGAETVFPDGGPGCVWDLYEPSDAERRLDGALWHVRTEGSKRFQLGLSAGVPWIEFRDQRRGLVVRRSAQPLAPGLVYIDIADRPPTEAPDKRGVRYSIYSDAAGFMEIEAAGGMPARIEQGDRLAVTVCTEYSQC